MVPMQALSKRKRSDSESASLDLRLAEVLEQSLDGQGPE
jgi:hypothetical protein